MYCWIKDMTKCHRGMLLAWPSVSQIETKDSLTQSSYVNFAGRTTTLKYWHIVKSLNITKTSK